LDERKYYAPGIGLVFAIGVRTGEREKLVNIIRTDRDNFRDLGRGANADDSLRASESSRALHHNVQAKGSADYAERITQAGMLWSEADMMPTSANVRLAPEADIIRNAP